MSDERTHLIRTPCVGECGSEVWADPTQTTNARCSACWQEHLAIGAVSSAFGVPDPRWLSTNNPAPAPAVYPPGSEIVPFAVGSDMTLRCIVCRKEWPAVDGLTAEQISASFAGHDKTWHNPDGWLVGPAGGARGEVCNPCAGYDWEKNKLPGGPDHKACRKGKGRGWQATCDCQHRSRAHRDAIAGTPITPEAARDNTPARPTRNSSPVGSTLFD